MPENNPLPTDSIDELPLSNRAYNALKRAGVSTVAEIPEKAESARNFGNGCRNEINPYLRERGLPEMPLRYNYKNLQPRTCKWRGINWGLSNDAIAAIVQTEAHNVAIARASYHTRVSAKPLDPQHGWITRWHFSAARCAEWRQKRGYTQAQVTAWMGRSRNWLTEIERGHKQPSGEDALRLALLYGVHPRDLMTCADTSDLPETAEAELEKNDNAEQNN